MKKFDYKNITIKKLAGIVEEALRAKGIDSVLVGGACVSIYTANEYISKDLDFVTYSPLKKVKPVLEDLGFKREGKRRFVKEACEFYIEFVAPPVGIGHQVPIESFSEISDRDGKILLLTPTDCVKDRLAAYYHWADTQSLKQAVMVARKQEVDLKEIKEWSEKESSLEKFEKFVKFLNK